MQKDITRTLAYSDIFDYPLTKEEIWKFLIGKKIARALFEKQLRDLVTSEATPLGYNRNFYYLSGREEIVEKRIKKKKESEKKLEQASEIIQKLSRVPTVLFVGVSGGLALENADEKDDIDLFVITSKRSLWITRLLLVLLLILMGQYRGRGNPPAGGESNKICLNMLVDEEALVFKQRNLYTAHEIVQLKPMFDRNNTYNKFLAANRWVGEFLPNAFKFKETSDKKQAVRMWFAGVFEHFAKAIQLSYMKKHRTIETIEDHFLAFHPFQYRDYVLKEYNKRLKRYAI